MSLSGGQKQRLSIGAAMMKHANIFILDEPTSGLDYENMTCIKNLILMLREQGKIILIITHDYEFLLNTCTRVLHMADGKIYRDYVLDNRNHHLLRDFFIPEKEEIFYEQHRKINS
jgi:energy-coupling factor transport system ATP-binding protein